MFTIRHPKTWTQSAQPRERSALSQDEYLRQIQDYFSYGGNTYGLGFNQSLPGKPQEPIGNDFVGYVRGAYKANGIVFACILARMALFSEARFQFRRMKSGKPQDLFGTAALAKLEVPWRNGTTGDLLARMEQDVSLGGNSYILNRGLAGLRRLRPDWTTIVIDSDAEDTRDIPWDPNAEIVGYAYTMGGPASGNQPQVFRAELVAHYAPIPDPEANFRGMSWLTPIVVEIMGDKAASEHKLDFFERGGTPNMTVEYNPEFVKDMDAFKAWRDAIEDQIAQFGPANRRLHLGGGTKTTVIGSSFEQIEFKATQGAGETRIAAAAGVPPVVAGLSEGLQGSSLNAGNFEASMRRFADITMRPLWRSVAGSLAPLVAVPNGAELWYDDRDITALAADRTDAADIQGKEAETIRALSDGGYKPESVIAAVVNSDWNLLTHTGLPSVQVQAPPTGNGSGSPEDAQQAVDAATTQEG
jgi:phage portal protein BeeE